MNKWVRTKFYIAIAVTVLTFWFTAPTLWSLSHPGEDIAKMPKWLPKTTMKLGLDLQGGVHMVMGIDLDKVVVDQLASYGRMLEKAAEKEGIAGVKSKVDAARFEMDLEAPSPEAREKISSLVTNQFSVLSFVGENGNTLVTRLTREYEDEVRNRAISQSIETIRNRIDEFGVAEPIIARKGDSQILVQFPGAKEPERLKSLIGQTAKLTFQIVPECTDAACLVKQQTELAEKIKAAEAKGNYHRDTFKRLSEYRDRLNADLKDQIPADTTVAFERVQDLNVNNSAGELRPYLLSTKNVVSGEYIENATVQMNRSRNQLGPESPVVFFQLNATGTPQFGALTTEFQNHYMAIVLDGIVKSAPVIQSAITGGEGTITLGRGSVEETMREARDLSIVLRAGALPATIEVQEERLIGPSMGADAIVAGQRALVIAGGIIFLFMLVYYGLPGLVANVVTLVNVGIIIAVLGMLGATLTLPGIAGIVLTIGMAVDAIIIIYERMREELRAGRNTKQTVSMGFDKAFATILDSNVTTAIGAFVLLQYGSGSIRGFALTLLVGIVSNVFMATFFTKALFDFFISGRENTTELRIGLSRKELEEATA
jgi:preprotein translocase subunit SecD